MTKEYKTIQIRRDTLSDFIAKNPILASGEPAFATDTYTFKVGNGITNWNNLPSFSSSSDISSLSGVLSNQIHQEILELINGSPIVLDTLKELADAINNDANFAVTISNNINTVSGIASAKINGSGSANYLSKWLNSSTLTDSIIYESGNRIGIGTQSDGSKLHITSSNNKEYSAILNFSGEPGTRPSQQESLLRISNTNNTPVNSFAGIFLSTISQSGSIGQGTFIACVSNNVSTHTPDLVFCFRSEELAYLEYMRISHSGNLGIGTNTPEHRLDVQGSGNFNGDLFATGSGNFNNGVFINNAPAIKSDISGISGNVSGVFNIMVVDQATFDNIITKNPNTIYYIS